MIDGFYCLWHHTIICRHNENDDIGYAGTSGTHCRKSFVARRIEKTNFTTITYFDVIRTNMLRNAARFTFHHIGLSDIIQKRGFSVIHMPHNCHHRGPWLQTGFRYFYLCCYQYLFAVFFEFFNAKTKFIGNKRDGVHIQALVDGYHHAQFETLCNDFCGAHIHLRSEFANSCELIDFENLFNWRLGFWRITVLTTATAHPR